MAKKLHSPTSLTEFGPLESENDPKPFYRKFFWRSKDKEAATKGSDDSHETKCKNFEPVSPLLNVVAESGKKDMEKSLTLSQSSRSSSSPINIEAMQNRNMNGILEMVRNIVEGKKMGLQNYKDSDFKQYWMPDSNCKECYECGDKFTTFRRRHHCRICGQIFCRRCCNQCIPGNFIGYSGDLRVCTYCYRMVFSCMQSYDSDSEPSDEVQSFHNVDSDFGVLQSDRLSTSQQNVSNSSRRKSSVMGFREEDIAKAKPIKSSLEDFCEAGSNLSEKTSPHHDQACLSDLYNQMLLPESGIRTLKGTSHPDDQYIRGSQIVEWLLKNNAAVSSADAVSIGQAFLDKAYLERDVTSPDRFVGSDIMYKLKLMRPDFKHSDSNDTNHESMEPLWVKEIQNIEETCNRVDSPQVQTEQSDIASPKSRSRIPSSSSSFYLDLDLKESTVKVSKPHPRTTEVKDFSPVSTIMKDEFREFDGFEADDAFIHGRCVNEGISDTFTKELLKAFNMNYSSSKSRSSSKPSLERYAAQQLKDENKRNALEELNSAYQMLETNLLRQLLENNQLSAAWCDIILPIVLHVIDTVHPDVKNDADSMDIRQYVQFKKIPGGNKSECTIISGVVFTKTVAHRKMDQNIVQPSILLLSSPISYQRAENKFSSLEPVIMQEFEYLKNTVGKLTICKPNVLLVEKSISRLAQEMLLALGITVALNIKPTVMERVARCTQAAIVSTVDAHLGKPQLGTCDAFKVKTYSISGGKNKTFLFLDGCPANLGCTILLRGGCSNELKKVKQIVQFMLYVAYNWKLERAFLMDECAISHHFESGRLDTFEVEGTSSQNLFENSDSQSIKNDQQGAGDNPRVTSEKHPNLTSSLQIPDVKGKCKTDESSRRLEAKFIDDFSDPLHSYLQFENDIAFSDTTNFEVNSLPVSNTFRKLLDENILCCSLNVRIQLPYLESEPGKHCHLRKFFPDDLYWSVHFLKGNEIHMLHSTQVNFDDDNEITEMPVTSRNVEIVPPHPFTSYKITDVSSMSIQVNSYLSDYRARGGTIKYLCSHQYALKGKEKKNLSNQNSDDKDAQKGNAVSTNTGLCWERKTDALDAYNHQKLAVLFCSYSCSSNNAPNYCVNPWIVKMDFYGSNDIPFGGFLEKYCFRSSYVCPSSTCDTKMTEHVRKFVHASGCVHILLHELSTGVQTADNSIVMWSWCHKCKQASSVVPMSQDTWSFSFAKYLELRFYASSYTRRSSTDICNHSLHHDHYQYFAHKQIVAIFEYNPIILWEIFLPPPTIVVQDEAIPIASVVEQIKHIAIKASEVNNAILEKLFKLKQQYVGTSCEEIISNMSITHTAEMSAFREQIEQIQWRLTSPTLETMQSQINEKNFKKDVCHIMWKIEDQVLSLKYSIAETLLSWNNRFHDFFAACKKEDKQSSKVSQLKVPGNEEAFNSSSASTIDEVTSCNLPAATYQDKIIVQAQTTSIKEFVCLPPSMNPANAEKNYSAAINTFNLLHLKNNRGVCFERSISCGSFSTSPNTTFSTGLVRFFSEPTRLAFNATNSKSVLRGTDDDVASNCSSASSYTYGVTPGIYAGLMVPEPEDSETYVVCHKEHCNQTHAEDCPMGRGIERSRSDGPQILNESFSKTLQEREDFLKPDKKERTVKTLLSNLLSSSDVALIPSPFPPSEHVIISRGEKEKIPVIVYDDEPSSIIAYTLASAEYEHQLQEMRVNFTSVFSSAQRDSQTSSPMLKRRQNSRQLSENLGSLENAIPPDEPPDFLDMVACSSQETDKDKGSHKGGNKISNFHLEIQFSDNSARFYCRVYYAEQFRKLRSLVFNESEERFIRSLRHCIAWVARGGKSGSTFCKTRDDRFILKQMQKLELQSFLELAPSYFQYINKAYIEQKPTLLAKIVGVYRIGYKNTVTNTASKMDLLVMENLFYNCNISRKYDLKGSIRNRLVNTNGLQEEDIVLLDENLLKNICDNPLYIRAHSKSVLNSAIDNDTHFLSDQSVMDYSLLVGLDEEKNSLVVGIIDYIRTFTWDKKVEMFVKSSGILGGHGKMPTVVSPELYRMRFREAMDGYFLLVPDHWTDLGTDGSPLL